MQVWREARAREKRTSACSSAIRSAADGPAGCWALPPLLVDAAIVRLRLQRCYWDRFESGVNLRTNRPSQPLCLREFQMLFEVAKRRLDSRKRFSSVR